MANVNDDEYKKFLAYTKKMNEYKTNNERIRAKNTIMLNKARNAKITVSDAEIDAYIKNKNK